MTARPAPSTAACTRVRHRAEEARSVIERAAVRFLARRPFRALSVSSLMAETALSRPAFYQYFRGVHELMEALLGRVREQITELANPWLAGEGEPTAALRESLRGVVEVGVEQGQILRAVAEAAPNDVRLERAWSRFMRHWDDAVTTRIEAQQREGRIEAFEARPVASALNQLNASTLIRAFGHRPKAAPEPVLAALFRAWHGTLYAPLPEPAPADARHAAPLTPTNRDERP